jgi:hypothetical protein
MDIPRPRNSFAAVAVLPAVLMPLSRAKEDDFALVAVGFILIAMAGALLLRCGFYMRRTPLVRIDETTLTFFGNAESDRRSFQRNAISSISLSGRPLFRRSSFRFCIVADRETVNLWIPYSSGGSIQALAEALRDQFPIQFKDVSA